jgi:methyltransferase (TIGR00027 family)
LRPRARESERADRLFDDPYAAVLAGRRGRAALVASEGATGGENEFLPIRTRFFDDVLRTAVDRLEQVVLLGAGLDTRAFRLALPPHLHWFEIDSARLFDEKERLLAELGAEARCQRTVVAADLTAAWSMPLLDSGFQSGCRTAWIAEGLLFYLPEDAARDVLAEARRLAGDGSLVATDMFGSGLLALPAMKPSLAARAKRGLPPPFTTDDPVATFKAAGWPSVELVFPGPLGVIFGRPIERAWHEHVAPDPTMQTYLVVARTDGREGSAGIPAPASSFRSPVAPTVSVRRCGVDTMTTSRSTGGRSASCPRLGRP